MNEENGQQGETAERNAVLPTRPWPIRTVTRAPDDAIVITRSSCRGASQVMNPFTKNPSSQPKGERRERQP